MSSRERKIDAEENTSCCVVLRIYTTLSHSFELGLWLGQEEKQHTQVTLLKVHNKECVAIFTFMFCSQQYAILLSLFYVLTIK